ncbi:MAG: hypothetical protein JWQ63_2019 [Mucilaginibacter sp.]|jgi:hypothetical protein|nr:hypothetical protein [Mucilaginibacter sp.]
MQKDFRPNQLKKTWLKLTNKEDYKKYKQHYSHHKLTSKLQKFADANLDTTIDEILINATNDPEINVLHNGNAGDIIYSLPIIKTLFEIAAKPINLILKINEPLTIGNGYEHPLGNVMLNEKMVDGLMPLLDAQNYLNNAATFAKQKIHVDLTLFRKAGFALDKGDIARWNFFITGITPNLSEVWLKVKPNPDFADFIVLARSSRYNNALIDYSFLSKYRQIIFVGVKTEYEEMKKSIPGLQWQQVEDFLELAEIIAGCKLFIGNQSFPYSIAEGLKVKRLLEVFYQIPNVMPTGNNGYDFCFQKHFEWLVKQFGETKDL